jgi:phosphatidate cytidylyltransferase
MLWKRLVSAGMALPLVLVLVHLGPTWAWALFLAFCTAVAMYEYLAITMASMPRGERSCFTALGVAFFWGALALGAQWLSLLVMAAFLLTFAIVLLRPGDLSQAFPRVAALVTGFVYIPLLLSILARLHTLPLGREWIYVAFIVAWAGDTFAYFAGRAFGRHKLYPLISPGKTWEGALGGLAGSVGGVLVARYTFFPELSVMDCFLVAVPGAILGQVGDLCESLLKRGHGVKDSGGIMPGHGGLLDRIDALLFLLPYILGYAVAVHPLML